LFLPTGWHWGRSDMDNASGYRIVELMCAIELVFGLMTLAAACYPTPQRFKWARIALTPVHDTRRLTANLVCISA
jgi:hypothetical protein